MRVVWGGVCDNFEKNAEIINSAGHGADYAEPREKFVGGREVAGAGDAARSGFESTNAAEVGGDADGAAAIATDSCDRATGGDSGGFTSAGAAGAVGKIPGVAGFSLEEIVGFVVH